MGLIQRAMDIVGVGPSPEERRRQKAKELSSTYPDTPEMTYRCGICEEIIDARRVGKVGLTRAKDDEMKALTICPACSER